MNPILPPSQCPQCQAVLPADAPQGLCPGCLMALAGQATEQDTLPLGEGDLPELEEIGRAFPDLEVLGKIGQGGMGVVYKARQPRLDRLVALKVLPKALAATPGFIERFTREGRVLARLNHPHIVAVHDFGESGGFCYLLMEYVDGVNLRQAMKTGRFSPAQALRLVPDICAALQAAHEQGVLHRDIKPENILLDSKGRVKIADFGIAKLMGEPASEILLTQSGARLGTAPYMAPEQVEQPAAVDHRADIYSLGVVFYEMLTGELPLGRFAAPSEKAEVSGGVDAIVLRALEKERDRRQQSAGELRTQIEDEAGRPMTVRADARSWESFEYQSRRMLCGLPLLHVVHGPDPVTGKSREAHGFFAFGGRARGVVAMGSLARGWVACGGLAYGALAFGGMGIGLVSISGLSLGLISVGGLAAGLLSMGGLAAGWHSAGGLATGWHAIGSKVYAHQGHGGDVHAEVVVKKLAEMPELTQLLAELTPFTGLVGPIWVPLTLLMILVPWWARRKMEIASGAARLNPACGWDSRPHRIFWLVPALLFVLGILGWALMTWARGLPPRMEWALAPAIFSLSGLVMFVTSLPLWLRLVPVNPFYGVRLPSTMHSSSRWYDVNAHAGKQLFQWSLVMTGAGIAGFYQLPRHLDSYSWAALTLTLVAVGAVVVSTLWWLRTHPENGEVRRRGRLANWSAQVALAVVIALFIRSFIIASYREGGGGGSGIAKGSHWMVSRLDTGFAEGEVVVYEHDNGQHWLAKVVRREDKGLMLKRKEETGEFFMPWKRIAGKLMFSHFSPGGSIAG